MKKELYRLNLICLKINKTHYKLTIIKLLKIWDILKLQFIHIRKTFFRKIYKGLTGQSYNCNW